MAKPETIPSKTATIILDSGCFLQLEAKGQTYSEIGYFQCAGSASDFRVMIDGKEKNVPELNKLAAGCDGPKCKVEVRHKDSNERIKTDGVKFEKNFHDELLEMKDLYDAPVPVSRENFECVIRFDSGTFSPREVRKRVFKEHKKLPDGKHELVPDAPPKPIKKPIMHDVAVSFTLAPGESIEFARNGKAFWSIKEGDIADSLEIKILADDSTAPRYFCDSFGAKRDTYLLPNPSDPPPSCPSPPCLEGGNP
jgi:hypothetical protein